jgi:hypothetical protein
MDLCFHVTVSACAKSRRLVDTGFVGVDYYLDSYIPLYVNWFTLCYLKYLLTKKAPVFLGPLVVSAPPCGAYRTMRADA